MYFLPMDVLLKVRMLAFYGHTWWRKPENLKKITDLRQVTTAFHILTQGIDPSSQRWQARNLTTVLSSLSYTHLCIVCLLLLEFSLQKCSLILCKREHIV